MRDPHPVVPNAVATEAPSGPTASPFRLAALGFAATLVGVGLARFGYTPLIPPLVEAGWFTAAEAAYLGAANLLGYWIGALAAPVLASRLGGREAVRLSLVVATMSFFACALPGGFAWFFLWRWVSGLAGAVLMVLAASLLLPAAPAHRRGRLGGAIFSGVGAGALVSAVVIPPLLRLGLPEAWAALGIAALALTVVSWTGWPETQAPRTSSVLPNAAVSRRLGALVWIYGLNAFALVPAMVFLVDYVARGLGGGMTLGIWHWSAFGLGALLGPPVAGMAADRIGFGPALGWSLAIQILTLVAYAWLTDPWGLLPASLVIGAVVPGIVPLVVGCVHDRFPDDPTAQRRAWSRATAAFALGQAAGAYLLSTIFAASGGDHALLYQIAAAVLAMALILHLMNRP